MEIQLDSNQRGVTGDMVPSKLKAGGKKHYVSPKINQVMKMHSPHGLSCSRHVPICRAESEQ